MKYPLLILISLTCLSGQNLPFKVGEKLEYTAQFNVLPVGEATLTVVAEELYQGKPALQVKYQASTGDVADHLFRIRDNINIWFDRQDMYTYRVEKKIEEGKFRKKISTFIDYYDSIAITNKDTVRINQGVRDPYSLFYYLRTRPLEDGQTLELTTFDNNKSTSFTVEIKGGEKVRVPAGTFSCLAIKPYRKGPHLFKNQGDMEIWLSDDARRIPVQIHIKLKYGLLVLRLKNIAS